MPRRDGFTLIELVVVIMILGILAGVAAPKLLSVSDSATDNGLKQTLSIVRDAVELYASDHGGDLPPCTGVGSDFRKSLAPYMRGTFPVCPVGAVMNFDVTPETGATTTADASPTASWKFNTDDGSFICNYGAKTKSDGAVSYEDL